MCVLFFPGQIKTNAVLDVESKQHYWLTVYAQDHGVVPMHSRLEVSTRNILSLFVLFLIVSINFIFLVKKSMSNIKK